MLDRLSAPQRWLVGGAVLAFIILLAAYALSRDIARRADTPLPTVTLVPAPAPTALPTTTTIARPPAADAVTAGRAEWLAGLALALAGVAVVIAAVSALTSRRRLADLHRRQGYPALHAWLAWDATDEYLVVYAWNAGPGAATSLRCGLSAPHRLTGYATHSAVEAGQGVSLTFPALSRAAGVADAEGMVAIELAWRPATAGGEEIVHRYQRHLDAPFASNLPAATDGRLAPHVTTVRRRATRLIGEPYPTR